MRDGLQMALIASLPLSWAKLFQDRYTCSLKLSFPSSCLPQVMLNTSRIHLFHTAPISVRPTVHCPCSGFVGSGICHLHVRQGLFVPFSNRISMLEAFIKTSFPPSPVGSNQKVAPHSRVPSIFKVKAPRSKRPNPRNQTLVQSLQ